MIRENKVHYTFHKKLKKFKNIYNNLLTYKMLLTYKITNIHLHLPLPI